MRMLVVLLVLLTVATEARGQACDSNLMIVLDRSCSMDDPPTPSETRTKWQLAVEAITMLTSTYSGQLNFGLIMFPDEEGADCAQESTPYVNVAPGNEAAVVAALAGTKPIGPCVTNIDTGIGQVSTDPVYQQVDPSGRRSFVVLISDGEQSVGCGGDTADATTIANIEALYGLHYPTYVVGFGGGVDPADLDAFALAGGVPKQGGPGNYYQADTAGDLAAALDAIAGQSIGDPEFGCRGIPCPDMYCADPAATCVEGECDAPRSDAGPMVDAPVVAGIDAGGGATGDGGGCDCRVGGRRPLGVGGVASGLVLLMLVWRTRRSA